jgi:phosphate transport system ATP-binding protein
MFDLYPGQRAEGQIIFNGKQHPGQGPGCEPAARTVGMVFQKPTPFPMSIYDNIAFGVRLHESLSNSEMDTTASSGRCARRRCGRR